MLFRALSIIASVSLIASTAHAADKQVAQIVDSTNFCVFLPPTDSSDRNIADTEWNANAFCMGNTPKADSAGKIPAGFIQSAHFVATDEYVQVTGQIDPKKANLDPKDDGGQYDIKAPDGSSCAGWDYYVNLIEPSGNTYCIRCCNDSHNCNRGISEKGCAHIIPGDYSGPMDGSGSGTSTNEGDDSDKDDNSSTPSSTTSSAAPTSTPPKDDDSSSSSSSDNDSSSTSKKDNEHPTGSTTQDGSSTQPTADSSSDSSDSNSGNDGNNGQGNGSATGNDNGNGNDSNNGTGSSGDSSGQQDGSGNSNPSQPDTPATADPSTNAQPSDSTGQGGVAPGVSSSSSVPAMPSSSPASSADPNANSSPSSNTNPSSSDSAPAGDDSVTTQSVDNAGALLGPNVLAFAAVLITLGFSM